MNDRVAGLLTESDEGYTFIYDDDYIENGKPVSFSLPLKKGAYRSEQLFYFFKGLLPEGWTMDVYSSVLKIDKNDEFGMLLATCHDCIGAVTVEEVK